MAQALLHALNTAPSDSRTYLGTSLENELGEGHRRHSGLRLWHVIAVVVGAIGILIVAAVASPNWNLLRGPVAVYLSGRLDRPVAINGDFKVRVSLQPQI